MDILKVAKMKIKSLDLEIILIGLVTVALSIAGGEMALAGILTTGHMVAHIQRCCDGK
jgi:hypothetical protein